MDIKGKKTEVREKMSSFRIRPEERVMASAAVCDRVRAGDDYRTAGTVLLYAPLPDEVDVLALMSGDKRFCFPRTSQIENIQRHAQNPWKTCCRGDLAYWNQPPGCQKSPHAK